MISVRKTALVASGNFVCTHTNHILSTLISSMPPPVLDLHLFWETHPPVWEPIWKQIYTGLLSINHSVLPEINTTNWLTVVEQSYHIMNCCFFSLCRAPEVQGKYTVLAREIMLLKETSTSQWWLEAGSINRWAGVSLLSLWLNERLHLSCILEHIFISVNIQTYHIVECQSH